MNSAWDDSLWALAALSIDPGGLKGIWLRTSYGPVTQEWLHWLFALRPLTRKLPSNVDTERLLGGLDLSMTLQQGRAIQQSGLLAQSDGQLLLCPMAERLSESSSSILTQVLDTQQVSSQFAHGRQDTTFGLIALDESSTEDKGIASSLREQLGIWLDLNLATHKDTARDETLEMLERVERNLQVDPFFYRGALQELHLQEKDIHDVCELAHGFSIDSLRAPGYAMRLARAFAALKDFPQIQADDLGRAARLVLTPRAISMPPSAKDEAVEEQTQQDQSSEPSAEPESKAPEPESEPFTPEAEDHKADNKAHETQAPEQEHETSESEQNTRENQDEDPQEKEPSTVQALETSILEAALATLPLGLLKQLAQGQSKSKSNASGRVGDIQKGSQKGRPLPPLKGQPSNGNRLHVLATLRHAAPRQKIRQLNASPGNAIAADGINVPQRIQIRSEDFHVQRFAKRSESCIVFCIDASGSAALERLAEAKGAVELLLKDSYARRDHICVIGFRDRSAKVHLPITRSLLRAKRELQALPGGGGTPLATALKLCAQTSLQASRQGMTPTLVVLSDGRANVTLEGEGSRAVAKSQALTWAKQWRALQLQSIWLDTSARADPQAREIALAMGAHYVPLPHANSQRMAQTVQMIKETQN